MSDLFISFERITSQLIKKTFRKKKDSEVYETNVSKGFFGTSAKLIFILFFVHGICHYGISRAEYVLFRDILVYIVRKSLSFLIMKEQNV